MKCIICEAESPGPYCPSCGAPVEGARCKACDAGLMPGARFCIRCGEAVRRAPSRLAWYVAAAAVGLLLVVVAWSSTRTNGAGPVASDRPAAGTAPVGAAAGGPAGAFDAGALGPGAAPPLTGTPREQADRLFNRIMQALALGDTAEASFFLPMGILAYRQAGELDADGLYHLSILETESGDAASGLATAQRILASAPDHLLGLGAAARAAEAVGDASTASRLYRRFLDVYDAERARELPEYVDHARILPDYRGDAESYLAARP